MSVPRKRRQPEIVTSANGKKMVAGGRWNHEVMADYIITKGTWVPVPELAKVGCGGNTKANQRRARGRLSPLFTVFRNKGVFLAVEYNSKGHHSATAVKLADLSCDHDLQCVMAKLEKMRKASEMTQHEYDETVKLLYAKRPPLESPGDHPEG